MMDTTERDALIVRLRNTDKTAKEIGEMFCLSRSWIYVIWDRHGVSRPPRLRWYHARSDALRTWWDSGASASEIGRALGVSRNAVIGRAHRMGLAPRRSPIIRSVQP